jgi:Mrp family chromosome partitioning ATPase
MNTAFQLVKQLIANDPEQKDKLLDFLNSSNNCCSTVKNRDATGAQIRKSKDMYQLLKNKRWDKYDFKDASCFVKLPSSLMNFLISKKMIA